MENLNKLTFRTYKVDESKLYIPMEEIKQEFDLSKYSKKYLFKILYIAKHLKDDRNYYTVYLGAEEDSDIPIVKATIPLEFIMTDKILPNYQYDRPLDKQERFIVNERIYRIIDKLNYGLHKGYKFDKYSYYVLIYGYMVNSYKNDNALTTIKEGIQEFSISEKPSGVIQLRGKTTTCFVTNKWEKICNALQKEINKPNFKELPKDFFLE